MTTVQRVAQIVGWVFVAIGLLGFLATGGSMEADPARAPHLLGLFPVNVLHNLVHLAFGVWGILAARAWSSARSYCLISGALYAGLAVLGFVTPSLFGLVPIGGHDIWLHFLLAAVLLWAGLSARERPAAAR